MRKTLLVPVFLRAKRSEAKRAWQDDILLVVENSLLARFASPSLTPSDLRRRLLSKPTVCPSWQVQNPKQLFSSHAQERSKDPTFSKQIGSAIDWLVVGGLKIEARSLASLTLSLIVKIGEALLR
tara:strand:- start:215 stop:589 length:375 start_codon:yes stop_codon:yes gene_type:complete